MNEAFAATPTTIDATDTGTDTSTDAGTPTEPGDLPGPESLNERLCHLFRASLKNGRIHPLYLPILKYRHSRIAP